MLKSCFILPKALKDAFDINARPNTSINAKIRSKLRRIYFQRDFDMLPIVEIKATSMPNVLESIGTLEIMNDDRCAGNLNGMYKFIRNRNAAV